MSDDRNSVSASLARVNHWSVFDMTALNREILAGRLPAGEFERDFRNVVLGDLPAPERLVPGQAQQLLVLLGLAGASIGRHYQEASRSHRATPERAFDGLTVGAGRQPFRAYFARVAERTGTGHCDRDSYASLVRWNVPAVEVEWDGWILADLPSAFCDGLVRSYTAAVDEQRFFGLLKASEVLERAVNAELSPLSDGSVELDGEAALRRIARAVRLLDMLREMNHAFADRPAGQGLDITHFMDVFRQYAVHWDAGDIPPSGALDAEALIRDLLVGIDLPSYPDHVRRVSPGLLEVERETLRLLMDRPSLPEAALRLAGLGPEDLAAASATQLRRLVTGHPVLAALYLLLHAHARVAGVHLLLAKRFLFDPQRMRDRGGLGDPGVVSNRTGTTGMDEARMEMITRARRHHLLAKLRTVPVSLLRSLACPPKIVAEQADSSGPLLRFTGSHLSGYDLGLPPAWQVRLPEQGRRILVPGQSLVEHGELGPV